MNRTIISGLKTLFQKSWMQDRALVIENGKIIELIACDDIKKYLPATQLTFPKTYYLTPGFIDLHIHGCSGSDVMDASSIALQTICSALHKEGVTGFLATTMTSNQDHIEKVLQTVAKEKNSAILGVHLEGPFVAKEKAGAQFAEHCLMPDIELLKSWQQKFNSIIKILTVAPELQNATSFIREATNLEIVLSLGHTNATFAETNDAISAGAAHATHLFNAMRGIHQREPGAVGALLLNKNVMTEMIVDGIHLHPAIVQLVLQIKTKDKILLVTDAIRGKCLGDGSYELGGRDVTVKNGKATLPDGTLAGSTLTMPEAIKNVVAFTNCQLQDAIQMATLNPAHALGLTNKGEIAPNKDADLVVLNENLAVMMTIHQGEIVFENEKNLSKTFSCEARLEEN